MQKKLLRYGLLISVIAFAGYQSVYFKKLSTLKQLVDSNLQPAAFASQFWDTKLLNYTDSAADIQVFLMQYKNNQNKTISVYSRSPENGSMAYILLKGEGSISGINEDAVSLTLKPASGTVNIKLLTGKYFGNAIRDLSGYIQMGDFKNSMDYNLVAAELNKIVFDRVINPFKTKAEKGAAVQFVGCAELNRDKPNIENITIIPLKLKY